jgi:hypothetical protein
VAAAAAAAPSPYRRRCDHSIVRAVAQTPLCVLGLGEELNLMRRRHRQHARVAAACLLLLLGPFGRLCRCRRSRLACGFASVGKSLDIQPDRACGSWNRCLEDA